MSAADQGEGLQLKRASELLVKSLGGIEAVAALLGKGSSTVGRWVNRNDGDSWINLHDLREAEANAKQPLVTMALCRMAGGVFVPNIAHGADEGTLAGLVMQLSKELGDVAGSIAAALADGECSPDEAEQALRELDEMARVKAQLRTVLEGIRNREARA